MSLGIMDRVRGADSEGRAHELAMEVLEGVAAHATAGRSLNDFFRLLAATVGDLVNADRVVFWRLTGDGMLIPIPGGYGVDRGFLSRLLPTPCRPGGGELASQVVYADTIFRASRRAGPAESAYVLDTLGVASAISVPWRSADERLGLVAAYDSRREAGFSWQDAWALQTAGLAAGLVTRLWQARDELKKSLERLTKVDGARQMLLRNMTTVVEKERQRLVTELHDDALQKLTAAELQIERLAGDPTVDGEALMSVRDLLAQTEAALRKVVFDVRPPALENPSGLAQSVRDRVAMLAELGIQSELVIELPDELGADERSMIFRQVAEAVGNVERHSNAKRVTVSLTQSEGGILGVVEDDGQGFVVAERTNLPGHLGLLALRERALMAGGRYKIESTPGAGTRIEFWIPLPADVVRK